MTESEFGEREGERGIALPEHFDAGLYFIGRIATPWRSRAECPKNSAESDTLCTITVDAPYADGLKELGTCSHVIVLYWMDRAPRHLVLQKPRHYGDARRLRAALAGAAEPDRPVRR